MTLPPTTPDNFLQQLAHDLRSPLGIVLGSLNEMSANLAEPESVMVVLAERAAQRLNLYTDRLSLIGRFQAGDIDLTPGPVDVSESAQSALGRCRQLFAERGMTYAVTIPPGLTAKAPPKLLQSCCLEILFRARSLAQSQLEGHVNEQELVVTCDCRTRDEALIAAVADDQVAVADPSLLVLRYAMATANFSVEHEMNDKIAKFRLSWAS